MILQLLRQFLNNLDRCSASYCFGLSLRFPCPLPKRISSRILSKSMFIPQNHPKSQQRVRTCAVKEKPVFRASLALSTLEIELYQISHFQWQSEIWVRDYDSPIFLYYYDKFSIRRDLNSFPYFIFTMCATCWSWQAVALPSLIYRIFQLHSTLIVLWMFRKRRPKKRRSRRLTNEKTMSHKNDE